MKIFGFTTQEDVFAKAMFVIEVTNDLKTKEEIENYLKEVCGLDLGKMTYFVEDAGTLTTGIRVDGFHKMTTHIPVVGLTIGELDRLTRNKERIELIAQIMKMGKDTYVFEENKPIVAGWVNETATDIVINSVSYDETKGLTIMGYPTYYDEEVECKDDEVDTSDLIIGALDIIKSYVK